MIYVRTRIEITFWALKIEVRKNGGSRGKILQRAGTLLVCLHAREYLKNEMITLL